ncbi:alpha/beta-hydrolase [Tilletiaria anomala UBC 951]|uniref:Protein phosphatase methylesterase 1 n=1 Tax=Tilletiaria anomala (strain ATCC 24038 / CBS 436.72 / UBC 951) TaxID=1037660 RepID=A0A066W6F9_TILAU|nr:alpha/beta-hydrolase [Tilletiaria anomala UBC 951]KDN49557.1 alpha/beta-hydrolase [Tilletiaria anomala UBC 951]
MQDRNNTTADLRTNFLKSRLARLPHLPAIAPGSAADLGSQSCTAPSLQSAADPMQQDDAADGEEGDTFGAMPPPLNMNPRGSKLRHVAQDDWSPLTAEGCFAEALEVDVAYPITLGSASASSSRGPSGTAVSAQSMLQASGLSDHGVFRVYYTPPISPSLRVKQETAGKKLPPRSAGGSSGTAELSNESVGVMAINGASEAALLNLEPLALEDDEGEGSSSLNPRHADDDPGTVFFLIHGAGFSALSWALMAREITKSTNGEAGLIAVDCRGHGRTRHPDHHLPLDMSLDSLTADMIGVLRALYPSPKKVPNLVLVGHSMGGSVAVSLAHALLPSFGTPPPIPSVRLTGVAVLDVVEGTAMDALSGMEGIVKSQPQGFVSVEEAIRWHVESNTIQNRESARRSVPPLVVPNPHFKQEQSAEGLVQEEEVEEILEEIQEKRLADKPASNPHDSSARRASKHPYIWRADLLASAPYWSGWFQGLSLRFLEVRCARLLLLAGADRLDKDLMIGQMQGKYQLVVYQDVGHCLQEDAPARTAQTLIEFWRRNESIKVKRIVPGSGVKESVRLHKVGQ